jgi:hypothetical protein
MINELKILVNFLNNAKVNNLEIFTSYDFQNKNPTKMGKVFDLINLNDFEDFDQLKKSLQGDIIKDWGVKKLLQRFQEKLINTLFFVDTNSPLFSERAKAYYNCSRRTIAVRMLAERGARKMAIDLAENTIPVTIKYEFTDLTVLLARFLIRQFSTTFVNPKKFEKFRKVYTKNNEMLFKELSIEEIAGEILLRQNSNKPTAIKSLNKYNPAEMVQKAMNLAAGPLSIELILMCSSVILDFYKEQKNFIEFKKWTKYFADKIFSKPFLAVITLEILITSQLKITIISKDASTALEIDANYFDKLNIGNFNWYACNYYFILTMFHTKRYFEGADRLISVASYKTFAKQPTIITELYYILQAYASFLYKIEKITTLIKLEDFRINKFLNQVPDYSRDKQGTNIPIILVQILFFLADKKFNKIIDRIESLNLYSYRHLKKDENFRSQCFIRMISEMVRADFRKTGTIFRTEKLFNKLQAVPIETYPNSAETEIIPYEDLWAMIVERLD